MKSNARTEFERADRLTQIRSAFSEAAEMRFREAEAELNRVIRELDANAAEAARIRAELAQRKQSAASDYQMGEKYLRLLASHRSRLMRTRTAAEQALNERRAEWTEALRNEKISGKIRERRLHELRRETDLLQQKESDDLTSGRYARSRQGSGETHS